MAASSDLLGTWRMISWARQAVAAGAVSDAIWPNPGGYIAYHAYGRMMAPVFRRDRVPANRARWSESERAALFDSMLAYMAGYSLEGDRVIHHVERAWNPNWEINLSRPFTLVGGKLTISGASGTDPETGEEVIHRVEFVRG